MKRRDILKINPKKPFTIELIFDKLVRVKQGMKTESYMLDTIKKVRTKDKAIIKAIREKYPELLV